MSTSQEYKDANPNAPDGIAILSMPAVEVTLDAGDVNIGNVDVLSIAAGDNNIGNVDVVTLPALPAGTNAIGKLAANSGVNIGSVKTIPPSTIYCGTKTVTTAGTRVTLASSQALEKGVQITAAVTNTGIIYVGNGSVSNTVYMAALYAGDTYWVDIDNLATVNLDSSVNGEGVSYGGV